MRIAVIGAGITGVTTAFHLSTDGHEVTVFDRHASVACEASALCGSHAGQGRVAPWAWPSLTPSSLMPSLFPGTTRIQMRGAPSWSTMAWAFRRWKLAGRDRHQNQRRSMLQLVRLGQNQLHEWGEQLRLDWEETQGSLTLMRTAKDRQAFAHSLKVMTELGLDVQTLDADECRRLEPGLSEHQTLHSGFRVAGDLNINARQAAQGLKQAAQELGAQFLFHREVVRIDPGAPCTVHSRQTSPIGDATDTSSNAAALAEVQTQRFDAVVLCAAQQALPLLASHRQQRLPLQAVFASSVTVPLRTEEGAPPMGPQSVVIDARSRITLCRIGRRVRVSGGAELGAPTATTRQSLLDTLYSTLQDWFPGAALLSQAQHWRGAQATLPDGVPAIGPSGLQSIWLNIGHGPYGWAAATGSAIVVGDGLAGRTPAIATAAFNPYR